MNFAIFAGLIAVGILLGGCGKKNSETGSASPPTATSNMAPADTSMDTSPASASAGVSGSPVVQPVLIAWQEGDKARAINLFVGSDWSARPTFPGGMALSLSEGQLKALPEADRALKYQQVSAQLDLMKEVVAAVNEAGQAAVASGEVVNARRCFMSLKQFGAALDNPDRLQQLQILGKVSKNMADAGLGKLGKSAAANP